MGKATLPLAMAAGGALLGPTVLGVGMMGPELLGTEFGAQVIGAGVGGAAGLAANAFMGAGGQPKASAQQQSSVDALPAGWSTPFLDQQAADAKKRQLQQSQAQAGRLQTVLSDPSTDATGTVGNTTGTTDKLGA